MTLVISYLAVAILYSAGRPALRPVTLVCSILVRAQMLLDSLTNDVYTPTPTQLARELFSEASLKYYFSSNASLQALSTISHNDLLPFWSSVFDRSFIELLVTGNSDMQTAVAVKDNLVQHVSFQSHTLASSPHPLPVRTCHRLNTSLCSSDDEVTARPKPTSPTDACQT